MSWVGSIGEPRRPLSSSRCLPTTELTADAAATMTVGAEPHGAVGCKTDPAVLAVAR